MRTQYRVVTGDEARCVVLTEVESNTHSLIECRETMWSPVAVTVGAERSLNGSEVHQSFREDNRASRAPNALAIVYDSFLLSVDGAMHYNEPPITNTSSACSFLPLICW